MILQSYLLKFVTKTQPLFLNKNFETLDSSVVRIEHQHRECRELKIIVINHELPFADLGENFYQSYKKIKKFQWLFIN